MTMGWQDRDYHREQDGPGGGGFTRGFGGRLSGATVTTWLLVINVVLLFWDGIFAGSGRGGWLELSQYGAFTFEHAVQRFQVWRFFTYQFLHADFFHLLFNMIALFFFGPMVEHWWGSRRYLAFYLLCGMSGALIYMLLSFLPGLISQFGQLVGASGSIFGILMCAGTIAPRQRVMLIFPPIPMQMRTLVWIFLGIAVLKVLADSRNAGGEAAHLGGAAMGWLLVKQPWLIGWADRRGRSRGMPRSMQRQRRKAERYEERLRDEQIEVDRILDKVRREGLHSLSSREKRTLQRATDRQRRAG